MTEDHAGLELGGELDVQIRPGNLLSFQDEYRLIVGQCTGKQGGGRLKRCL